MTKLKLGIGAIMIAGVAALFFLQHQAQVRLRDENRSLQERLDQLNQLEAENEQLSNLVAQANSSLSNEQLTDLLRLRGEVGSLRRQTNELLRLQEENRGLQATVAARRNPQTTNPPTNAAPQNIFPKESWTFAGYATPEAAFETRNWAERMGDVKTYLDSLIPESREMTAKAFPNFDGTAGSAQGQIESDITGYQIVSRQVVSDSEVVLNVLIAGWTNEVKFKMKKVGSKWKNAGPIAN